jgi:hypothetical protein
LRGLRPVHSFVGRVFTHGRGVPTGESLSAVSTKRPSDRKADWEEMVEASPTIPGRWSSKLPENRDQVERPRRLRGSRWAVSSLAATRGFEEPRGSEPRMRIRSVPHSVQHSRSPAKGARPLVATFVRCNALLDGRASPKVGVPIEKPLSFAFAIRTSHEDVDGDGPAETPPS